ncbi:protein kinase C-binding protein 1 isoform X3 [Willisornis vidua]|uniref:Protein kinase C-binding protein 1 isoform X3 n=1 Tax=Willisornis vidua TaxID=1566151 RepID=A0ABQ9D5P5_9PASS|nr:protein kinase C-binding protein 1 isoform X3 [Willisornis vidua]
MEPQSTPQQQKLVICHISVTSLAEEEIKAEQEVVEGMDISTRSKGQQKVNISVALMIAAEWDPGSAERTAQKRKFPSPPHSSNGHSPQDASTSPIKKKKKPGLLNSNNKEQKITVAECIETQSKAMTMLTIEQLSYLLKFALQKMKQPGNVKKKMYGCTEAFLADAKWILHNCIIYNGGNHKLTQTAKVIIKICEHEMNEIEVCPECYLAACQKRENWFCEPCSNPHPLVWAKLKGFPFWPAKALRDKDGQVDARFFGQHDRAWVPINNCYLMSKEIPFSVKKTKSIFNSAMQEMEVYVDNIRRKFGVFNYAPFRTPYTPNNQYQMLLDPANPTAGTAKTDKQEKIKLNFDMTASPKILMSKSMLSSSTGRRISLTDMPRSPMSTNSSVHTGSDVEQDAEKKATSSHFSASEESMDFIEKNTASPTAPTRTGQAGSLSGSPKPFSPQASTPVSAKQERTSTPGSILNLNLDRSKAEMDLKELSESVQQQSTPVQLISPKRQIRSRFQLNLDKTIESCKAQLGINEISEAVYTAVEHSDSEDSEKSDTSDSEYSDEDQKSKNDQEDGDDKEGTRSDKESSLKKKPKPPAQNEDKEELKSTSPEAEKTEELIKEKSVSDTEKDFSEKGKSLQHPAKEKLKGKDETDSPTVHLGLDSDSESELVIDLGDDHCPREGRKNKKESKEPSPKQDVVGKTPPSSSASTQPLPETPVLTRSAAQTPPAGVTATTSAASTGSAPSAATGSPVKKQRPLLPKETAPAVQRVVWNSSNKFQTSSQKWHMQKVQRQQQQQHSQQSQSQQPQSSQGTRYQTRQAVKAVQQKEITQSTSTSTITLVTSTQPISMVTSSGSASTLSSSLSTDLPIATASADVAADIAKYTSKMMDAIKGTMTEIYNDLSKNTTGSTIAEIRRLRIEIEKLQWLHQQELSEMKHNLELTMAEMRQSLEQERDRLIAEVKKQLELEKQQAVDETKKKQWCANCKKEAIFYCCWNTSYCDYPCQQAHWPEHMKSCTQSATATQQETDTEISTETLNKSSQPSSSVQSTPTETASTPKEKEGSADKSKDSVTIATGVTRNQPINLVQVAQITTYIPATQPTITIPVVVSPSAGTVAMRTGVQYGQTTMPVQVRRV